MPGLLSGHVADSFFRRAGADPVRWLKDRAFHGKTGAHEGRAAGSGQLQGAADFSSVTYHSGQVGYHVLNSKSHLLITASHHQVIPQLEPVAATTQPHKADKRPKLCLIYITVRWLSIKARISLLHFFRFLLQRQRQEV